MGSAVVGMPQARPRMKGGAVVGDEAVVVGARVDAAGDVGRADGRG